ncbi:MAG TPA: plastocyanin/azurin family copper-binding protein [Thermoanaerobaculia bacterium]|nr:plastocyanin/azurin family copper-binding protein [Thermoanaerobaculia bacterium]
MNRPRMLVAVLAALAPCAAAGDQMVQVGPGITFSPATLTVAPGETVTWSFQAFHTSTSDSQTGPETWDSGLLSSGTFSHTFQTPGTYPYYCAVHSYAGGTAMNGVVEVSSGAGATATPTPTRTVTPAPTSTPPTSPPPTAGGIPDLDAGGQLFLALTLAVVGVAALRLARRP